MGKAKFRYNPETLSYEKVERSALEKLLRGLIFIAPTFTLSIVFGFFLANRLDSPKEKRLKAELGEMHLIVEEFSKRLSNIDLAVEQIKQRDEELYRSAFGAKAFPEELRKMGIGGSDRYKELRKKSNADLLIATAKKLDEIEGKLYAQSISFTDLVNLAKEREVYLANLPAIQPVRNKDLKRIASGFGWRIDPVYGTKQMHWGLDFTADVGTEIYATGGGVVELVKKIALGYGKEVVINHCFVLKTRYSHLHEFKVKEWD
ncbi:MAG: M23 family metallopeptidase, partial [Crocinitomicaceae bacterium]|nr:M23 family metallopeptidase [Crocinitomicaceae bacterium]